jgi:hypothetical protein
MPRLTQVTGADDLAGVYACCATDSDKALRQYEGMIDREDKVVPVARPALYPKADPSEHFGAISLTDKLYLV